MTRFAAVLALVFPMAGPYLALDAVPARAGSMVSLTQGSTKLNGYLALPKGRGTHPGMIVVHEWWGLTQWVKAQADSLARHGYVALAVDLYKGKVANDSENAHILSSGLVEEDAVQMLRAGADFLRGRDDVRGHAIGAIGWCMGGKYAIRLAAADPGIRTVVMYYGAPITDEKQIEQIQAAVLGNFGAEDKGPTPEQVKQFEEDLREAGKKVDFKIYPGAGHAFANPGNRFGGYRASAARDAWKRTLAFLERDLKRASVPRRGSGGD